jgi:hypothetical protein
MGFLRTIWRFLVAVQLLPALEGGEETLVGGQAVLEGVMMRSPHAWAIACRKPTGEIVTHSEPLERLSEKHPWMAWPVVRGVMTFGHAMTLGFRALKFSGNVALEQLQSGEPEDSGKKKLEISGWVATVNIVLSVGFFIFMYKFVPLAADKSFSTWWTVSFASRCSCFSSGESRGCRMFTGFSNTTEPNTKPSTPLRTAIRSKSPPCRSTAPITRAAAPAF